MIATYFLVRSKITCKPYKNRSIHLRVHHSKTRRCCQNKTSKPLFLKEEYKNIIMNRFNTLLLISANFLALSCALPQGYGPGNTGSCQGNSCNQRVPSSKVPAGCRIDYRNIYEIEQVEYFDKKCDTKYK